MKINPLVALGAAVLVAVVTFSGCSSLPGQTQWTTLVDGA